MLLETIPISKLSDEQICVEIARGRGFISHTACDRNPYIGWEDPLNKYQDIRYCTDLRASWELLAWALRQHHIISMQHDKDIFVQIEHKYPRTQESEAYHPNLQRALCEAVVAAMRSTNPTVISKTKQQITTEEASAIAKAPEMMVA